MSSRGNRRDYALDPRPIARGGQATVFAATHKPTGRRVAFKRLEGRSEDMLARMRREVEAARLFGDHPNVMPVLDFSPTFDWFVMPLAEATAQTLAHELTETGALRQLVTAVCEALRLPHQQGWIHRDLKPDNLLRLDGRWVVADWGLGRRPRGQTTDARRTRMGTAIGTEGFAAPELAVDAHTAGPQADIYSIGQIIGWALTGVWPRANISLLPRGGPWRAIAKAATAQDDQRRLATVDELLATLAAHLDEPEAATARGRQLVEQVRAGDLQAPADLFRLAWSSDDDELIREGLLGMTDDQIGAAVTADPAAAADVAQLLSNRTPKEPRAITLLLAVARHAEKAELWDLYEDTVESLFFIAARVEDEDVLRDVAVWIAGRTGQAASPVYSALRGLRSDSPVHKHLPDYVTGRRLMHQLLDAPRRSPRRSAGRPAAPRRSRVVLLSAIVFAVLTASTAVAGAYFDWFSPSVPSSSQNNPFTGLPKIPGEVAQLTMEPFVEPWNDYPNWIVCRSGSGQTAVTGSFPAAPPAAEIAPQESIHCDNGGNLVAMFAEFRTDADYRQVRSRYFSAPPPVSPVAGESSPPNRLHVFAWSPTQRAVVWTDTDPAGKRIGLLITDSPHTDLVELWTIYQGAPPS